MKNLDSIIPKQPKVESVIRTPSPAAAPPAIHQPPPPPTPAAPLPSKPPKTRRWFRWLLLIITLAIVALAASAFIRASNLADKIFVGEKITFFEKIKILLRGGDSQTLIGENLGQINILLLGIGGEGHDGPYLSDTMIVAQIRPDKGEVALTSLPRDLWVEMPGNLGYRKINAAFAEGFSRYDSFALAGKWAMETTEKVTGLNIPYFAVVDFRGFEEAIDQIGGVEVQVERTFTDAQFPDENKGYLAPLTFKAGSQTMDGKTALQFARSRHGDNNEGSDFARSLRQQKVISSFKEKVLNLNLITDAGSVNRLLNTFADHFHTNLGPAELFRLVRLAQTKDVKTFYSLSLDESTGLLCSKILEENGAWVLLPCPGKSQEDIRVFFKNSFSWGQLKNEKSVVWLGSSSQDRSQYLAAEKQLKDAGLTVWEVGFGGEPLSQTIVYGVTDKPATVEFIANTLKAFEVTLPPPGIKIDPEKVDVVVILGKN